MVEVIKANGLLFIGDVHVSSRKPSRRTDADYAGAILHKLSQAMEIANRERLVPVLTGDLYHHAVERNEAVKARLMRCLRGAWTLPLLNVGNSHDISGTFLSDEDSLSQIEASGCAKVFARTGAAAVIDVDGFQIGLGFTPHGQEIPRSVSGMFPEGMLEEGRSGVVWVTHHDLAFDGAYPGAEEMHQIEGCAMVVNGHMHLYKQPVFRGETGWYNFGSLARTALDQALQEPTVWLFRPTAEEQLTPQVLEHEAHVFDLTGKLVSAALPEKLTRKEGSAFVDNLVEMLAAEPQRSDEGVYLAEEIRQMLNNPEDPTPPEVSLVIMDLLSQATGVPLERL